MFTYKYLFPFEKVPQGSKILIYGAGVLGQEYLNQLTLTHYCEVVGFVDKNAEAYKNTTFPVWQAQNIAMIDFDYVVIALRSQIGFADVKQILINAGVLETQIIFVAERANVTNVLFGVTAKHGSDETRYLAYQQVAISLAFALSGGIGDIIIQKRFIMELHRLLPEAKFDIYVSNNFVFTKWLYNEDSYIANIIDDINCHYGVGKSNYSLAISVIGSGFIEVDGVKFEDFRIYHQRFIEIIEYLQKKCQEESFSNTLPSAVMFYRRILNKENCYTGFNYGDVLSIQDHNIFIPRLAKFRDMFNDLTLQNYITVNIGNGTGKDYRNVAKAWPTHYFQQTIDLFKEKYSHIAVVQIGAKDETRLHNVDDYFMGKDFGLVAEILRHAMFHLDIEGGIVHLASQIGTKCIVLFGPTSQAYYAYDNNINISVGNCRDCYGLYPDTNLCARHMAEPECMYKITPELVIYYIDEYLGGYSNEREQL